MRYELEYTDKLPFDRQREIERALRCRAVHKETTTSDGSLRQHHLLIPMLVLLGALAGVHVLALWNGGRAAVAHAAAFAAEPRPVPALLHTPPHGLVAVAMPAAADRVTVWAYESDTHVTGVYPAVPHQFPDAALGTEGATNTTGTLFVAR
jgi:hypothetical protein